MLSDRVEILEYVTNENKWGDGVQIKIRDMLAVAGKEREKLDTMEKNVKPTERSDILSSSWSSILIEYGTWCQII